MLFWVPLSWGTHDEDGEFTKTQFSLAIMFSFFAGIAFLQFIERSVQDRYELNNLNIENIELEKIIEASHSESKLRYLIDQFNEKTHDLAQEIRRKSGDDRDDYFDNPHAMTIKYYNRLIRIAEKQIAKINQL